MKLLVALLILLPAVARAAAPADGQQIVLHGNANGAMPCAACHGVTGTGNSTIGAPALAGLPAATIVAYLHNFATGAGGDATMQYIAQALNPSETNAVATYFAAQKKP